MGWIYYIACSETMRIKIGYTSGDPAKRLRALQTGSPTQLTVMAVRPGAHSEEQRLHRQFASKRVHGEWFQMDADLFEHMMFVVYCNALDCAKAGTPVDHKTKLGLDAMKQVVGIPPEIESVTL